MTKAIEKAVKGGETKSEIKIPEQKKETMSLQELRHGSKNKNKDPSPENVNALKEALNKIQKQNIKEKTPDSTSSPSQVMEDKKEIPEDVLRKVLKVE